MSTQGKQSRLVTVHGEERMTDFLRLQARELDKKDPLRAFASEFVKSDGVTYLDDLCVGAMPKAAQTAVERVMHEDWAIPQGPSWAELWRSFPERLGEKVAKLIGAEPDEVTVSDSHSVNLYKLGMAAISMRPNRRTILVDRQLSPWLGCIIQGCARSDGKEIVAVDFGSDGQDLIELRERLSDDVCLVALSHVQFMSGARMDMAEITKLAHEVGASVLWDLSDSAGIVASDLDAADVDFAAGGCGTLLHGGPGAPGWLFVRRDLQDSTRNPIWGWFGQENPLEFSGRYHSGHGIGRYQVGVPELLSLIPIEPGLDMVIEAGIERIQQKTRMMIQLALSAYEAWLRPAGLELLSTNNDVLVSSYLVFGHDDAEAMIEAMHREHGAVLGLVGHRGIRVGLPALSIGFEEFVSVLQCLASVASNGLQPCSRVDTPVFH